MTSPLSPVVGEAQASPKLTDAERAAMGTDLHVIACDTPLGQCVECMTVFRAVRRIVHAVEPAIAGEARADERREAERDADALIATASNEGYRRGVRDSDAFYVGELCSYVYEHADTDEGLEDVLQFSVYELAELANCWRPRAWENYLRSREPARFADSDAPPVAAASIPIPDGEE